MHLLEDQRLEGLVRIEASVGQRLMNYVSSLVERFRNVLELVFALASTLSWAFIRLEQVLELDRRCPQMTFGWMKRRFR